MGLAVSAIAAVTLTLHPGQTLYVARLHVGEGIVCRTSSDLIRWKATTANLGAASFVWNWRRQLKVAPHVGRANVSCQYR
jgi:hypothetical protein